MAENNSSNIVAIVAIVVIVLIAAVTLYYVFGGQAWVISSMDIFLF